MLDIILFVLSDFLVYVIAVYLWDWSDDLIQRVSVENRILSACRSSIRQFAKKKNSNFKKEVSSFFSENRLHIQIWLYILRFTKFDIKYIIANIGEIFSWLHENVEKWLFLILLDQKKSISWSSYFMYQYNVGVLYFLCRLMLRFKKYDVKTKLIILFFMSRHTRRCIEIGRLRQYWHT